MERKVTHYAALQGTLAELNNSVTAYIADGWEPLGGISAAVGFTEISGEGRALHVFAQAMVRYN